MWYLIFRDWLEILQWQNGNFEKFGIWVVILENWGVLINFKLLRGLIRNSENVGDSIIFFRRLGDWMVILEKFEDWSVILHRGKINKLLC